MRLVDQGIMPPDVVRPAKREKPDRSGNAVVSFSSTADPRYQAMLAIIRQARAEALAQPRVDMPGAAPNPGGCRHAENLPIPTTPPPLKAAVAPDGAVDLAWARNAETIGLDFEIHRGTKPDFLPNTKTLVAETNWFQFTDSQAPAGPQTYALVLLSGEQRSKPIYTEVTVLAPPPPPAPKGLAARVGPGEVILQWDPPAPAALRYAVYRAKGDAANLEKLTKEPLAGTGYADGGLAAGVAYRYAVRAVDRRGQEGEASAPVTATPLAEMKDPLFTASFDQSADAKLLDAKTVKATLHGGAKLADKSLDLGKDGYATFPHLPEFDIRHRLSIEAWVRLDSHAGMPVVLSCGAFTQTGWFLQLYQGRWRWHIGGVSCDGGTPPVGQWTHVVATFDGHRARVFQNGVKVADCDCLPDRAPWQGPLIVGQYSGAVEGGFQVRGRIAGLRVYSRAISAEEAAAAFKAGPPK